MNRRFPATAGFVDSPRSRAYAAPVQPGRFDLATRRQSLERAATGRADVLVIGGGITGAGVARETALRGLSTVLVDKGDFSSGTSSRSSKLIHGGLRYLAQGDISLVREAARERAVLRRLAPHLAEPVWMMMPTASLAGRMKMQAGVWTFEKLAGSEAGDKFRVLDRAKTLEEEPGLRRSPLAGAVVFQEYRTDDARLVLETLQSAAASGALVANYAEVIAVEADDGGVRVTVRDNLAEGALEIRARTVVNASGPWFERVRSLIGPATGDASNTRLQLTRGIHVVVPLERLPVRHSVVLKSPDGRSTFVVPRGRFVYIGTTDTHYAGAPEEPGVSVEDTRYLLDSVAATFADAPSAADIIGTWSGVRPLLAQEGKSPSEISRRDEIITGPGPVVAIAGGKLTTYRRMSERVCAEVFRVLGRSADVGIDSANVPLAGGDESAQQAARRAQPESDENAALEQRLWSTYGVAAATIIERIRGDAGLASPVGGLGELTRGEVEHAVSHEMATNLDDVMRRRSRVAMFDTHAAIAAAPDVARVLGAMLGWDDTRIRSESDRAIAHWSGELALVRSA
jgi:glycerol-3-phosphate dehydrogenase